MREKILAIWQSIRSDVDFETETALLSGGVLESLDIVSFLFAVSDDLGVTIPVAKIKPAHFDSLDKMLDLINNLK